MPDPDPQAAGPEEPRPAVWPRPGGEGPSNDLAAFESGFAPLAERRGFVVDLLGTALGHPLLLATRRPAAGTARRLLIAAGFHGEEPAGPWGVLEFLRVAPDALLDRATLGIVPLVNATGFAAGGIKATAQGLNEISKAIGQPTGKDAVSLRIATDWIQSFASLAKTTNSMIVPTNVADLASVTAILKNAFDFNAIKGKSG